MQTVETVETDKQRANRLEKQVANLEARFYGCGQLFVDLHAMIWPHRETIAGKKKGRKLQETLAALAVNLNPDAPPVTIARKRTK